MEPLSIETRKDSRGDYVPPELAIDYEGWTLRAFEQHGQVKLKGRASPQFHYMTTVVATRGEGETAERKAITCLGTAPQVLTAMLLQLGASEDTARTVVQQADDTSKAEAKRQLDERRAAERTQLEEARRRAEEVAAKSKKSTSKPRKGSKPRLTEEERAKRQVEIDRRAKEARAAAAAERAKSKEQRDAERATAELERARFASHNQSNPNRHGTWPVQSGPVWSVPDIPDVYSADRIGGGNSYGSIPTVKAVTMFGSLYTITVGGRAEAVAWKLVPSLDYPGKAMTYSAHTALPDTHLYRYGYEGVLVYFKGQEYVLTQPVTLRKFYPPAAPAKEWPVVPELATTQTEVEQHIDQELALAREVREEGNIRSLPSEEANHRQEPRRRPPTRRKAA